MVKKLTILALAALALALLAGPVLASSPRQGAIVAQQKVGPKTKPHVISFTGTVMDVGVGRISVYIQMTNSPFIAKRGTTPWVSTGTAACYQWSGKTKTRIACSAVAKGDRVSINALATSTSITARLVEVNKPRY
jgi:hypothetical protein